MKILIAGAGSMGSVIGTLLADKNDVTFLRRSGKYDNPIRNTMTIQGVIEFSRDVTLTKIDMLTEDYDVVILACQSQDTVNLSSQLKPFISSQIPIVSFQNGIRNVEIIKQYFPLNPVVITSLWWGATLINETTVFYRKVGQTIIGIHEDDQDKPKNQAALAMISALFSQIPTNMFNHTVVDDISRILYEKLIFNIMAPAAALIRSPTFLLNSKIKKITHYMFDEALTIVLGNGIDIDLERFSKTHKNLASSVPNSDLGFSEGKAWKSSTQISSEKYGGKGSNVDFLLGELINLANEQDLTHSAIFQVREIIKTFPPNYPPLSEREIENLLASIDIPDCLLINEE